MPLARSSCANWGSPGRFTPLPTTRCTAHRCCKSAPPTSSHRRTCSARLYRSGADFAISVGQVAGQILAYHLLDEQEAAIETQIKFSRFAAGGLAGLHPWRIDALDRTGAKVVAVERGNEVLVEFDDDFVVLADDAVFVCGSVGRLERCQREFQVSSGPAVLALP